jgi:hypothetical protein
MSNVDMFATATMRTFRHTVSLCPMTENIDSHSHSFKHTHKNVEKRACKPDSVPSEEKPLSAVTISLEPKLP